MTQAGPIRILPWNCIHEHLEKEKTSPSLWLLDWKDDFQVKWAPKQKVIGEQSPSGHLQVPGGLLCQDGLRLRPCPTMGRPQWGSLLPRLLVAASGPLGLSICHCDWLPILF